MRYLKILMLLAVCTALWVSCESGNDLKDTYDFSKGVYIINEGSFNSNNGSISYFNPDRNFMINNIFESVNGYAPGDVIQSFSVVNDSLGYLIANNSHKIEIVRLRTFEVARPSIVAIYPRYFMQVSETKGYISAFTTNIHGYLYVVDLTTHSLTDSILTGAGPEIMIHLNNKLYVANSGGFYADSTIQVVNVATDEIEDTITVGKLPSDMVLDNNDHIWVYTRGYTNWSDIETPSYIQKINPESHEILWQAEVGMALDYMTLSPKMAINGNGTIIYYLRPDGVYNLQVSNPQIQASPLISGNFYGLEVNPIDGNIYVFESTSFSANGTLKIYDPSGVLITETMVGIGPNGATFNLDD
jgi:YVTN family beta-propeller protein